MYCEKCGTKLDDNAGFCIACGAPVAAENELPQQEVEGAIQGENSSSETAQNANPQNGEQTEINQNGEVQTQNAVAENETVNDAAADEFPLDYPIQEPKKSPLPKIIAGIVSAAVFIAAAVTVFNIISAKRGEDPTDIPVAYIKDDELMLRLKNKNESYLISDDAVTFDDNDYSDYVSYVEFSDDGKLIFFADDYSDGEFDLYYRKTKQKVPKGKNVDEKGVKISSGVSAFRIAEDGSSVLYIKNGKLYYSDLKDSRKIANDVSDFRMNADCDKILYLKDDDLYLSGLGKKDQPQKLDSSVDNIEHADDNFKNIYYKKNDALYFSDGKDKEKIASDVYDMTIIGETVFLTKEEEVKYKFDDLFDDDCAASDEEIEYPSYSDFSVGFHFDDDAYDKAYDEYREKEERDELREHYKSEPVTVNTYTLYRVEDAKAVKIDEDLIDGFVYNQILVKNGEDGSFEKIKMSTVTDYYDTVEKIDELTDNSSSMFSASTGEYYVLFESGKTLKIDVDCHDEYDIEISPDEKYIYCIEDEDDGVGTLNRYNLSEKNISSKTKICDDVSDITCYSDGNLKISGEDNVLGFYNGKYAELSDEKTSHTIYIDGTLFYLDDYSDSSRSGTLMKFKDGKKEKLDDDVHDYVLRGDGLCYYIKDYSTKKSQGDLFKKKGLGKSKLIDTDVSQFAH